MTMPHLMNCEHNEDGWCLDCVAVLQRDQERLDFLATCNEGWPVVEKLQHRHGLIDVYGFIAEVMPDKWEPDGKPVGLLKMQEAFRAMIDEAINEAQFSFGDRSNTN